MSNLGPLVPLFWISGDVSSVFTKQSGFCLICIAEANVMYIPCDPVILLLCQPLEGKHCVGGKLRL